MKILQIVTKFSFLLLILIAIEGLATWGAAYNFQDYNIVAWIFQACLLINLLFASTKNWGK